MDPSSHFALLVAINRYPGLSDLAGPENDAAAFRAWLLDKDGGRLDLTRIVLIKSSDFNPVTDPYDANPTDSHIKKALNAWLKKDGRWCDRVGERLYLYFAGHGFTAGSTTDPALFTAQAQLDDRTHIAAYRYAAKIANAGFFDEIVLVMDCCQDVLKAAVVAEPSWSPPDRSASTNVKLFVALGAPRGRKAFEQTPEELAATGAAGAPVHGYFSSVFLEALKSAPADAGGEVTARAVESTFVNLWRDRYQAKTGYEPPITAPRELALYRRAPTAIPASPDRPLGAEIGVAPALRHVRIDAADLGATVRVLDPLKRFVAQSDGGLLFDLPDGNYLAEVRVGNSSTEHAFQVEGLGHSLYKAHVPGASAPSIVVKLPATEFDSPIPAGWSLTRHEYQTEPARQLLDRAVPGAGDTGDATLFVFARDSSHRPSGPWQMSDSARRALRLQQLDSSSGEFKDVALDLQLNDGGGWCSFTRHLASGTYAVGARRRLGARAVWDELVLHVAAGWRTEVFVDCIDDTVDGRRYDLDNAAMNISPRMHAGTLDDGSVRQTELLREALARGYQRPAERKTMPVDPAVWGPFGTLLAAALVTFEQEPDTGQLRHSLQWLRDHWSGASADVMLLERWCAVQNLGHGAPGPELLAMPDDAVPMLGRSWALAADTALRVEFAPVVQRAVSLWRAAAPLWVQMQRPEALAARRLRGRKPLRAAAPMPTLSRDNRQEPDLRRIAAGLGRPRAVLSPLHQALRHALIDARDEDGPEPIQRAIDEFSRSAALTSQDTQTLLTELWDCAG